ERALEIIHANHHSGDTIQLTLGGYSDQFAGNPVSINGMVEHVGKHQDRSTAVIRFGGNNRVILTQHLTQVTDTLIFRPMGIPFDDLDIIVLKSRVHFRRGYHETGVAGAIFEVDAPGWGPADLSTLPYQNGPRHLYPIHRKQ
ncbi:MAG: MlrC C-terminal domain-containing protein, partial [Deltaproteobacteria bacterium]|nr:MlrC C-terminal domain-containing protein [Deltaproteobacteria bacterium]